MWNAYSVPTKVFSEEGGVLLVLSAVNSNLAVIQGVEEGLTEWLSVRIDTVVLVATLDQQRLRALDRHSLVESDDWLLYAELDVAEHVLQLTDADIQVKLSCSCNDELASVLVGMDLYEGVRLQ